MIADIPVRRAGRPKDPLAGSQPTATVGAEVPMALRRRIERLIEREQLTVSEFVRWALTEALEDLE